MTIGLLKAYPIAGSPKWNHIEPLLNSVTENFVTGPVDPHFILDDEIFWPRERMWTVFRHYWERPAHECITSRSAQLGNGRVKAPTCGTTTIRSSLIVFTVPVKHVIAKLITHWLHDRLFSVLADAAPAAPPQQLHLSGPEYAGHQQQVQLMSGLDQCVSLLWVSLLTLGDLWVSGEFRHKVVGRKRHLHWPNLLYCFRWMSAPHTAAQVFTITRTSAGRARQASIRHRLLMLLADKSWYYITRPCPLG